MRELGKSWVEVSEGRLLGNFEVLRRAAGVTVLPVVKADAYGHGAAICAPVLARAGAEWMGVTDAAEGVLVRSALRGAGFGDEGAPGVLVLCGFLPEDADLLVEAGLTPVVWTVGQMERLAGAVGRGGGRSSEGPDLPVSRKLPVHLEIDTGMSRQGVRPGAALQAVLEWLRRSEWLRLDGVLTHFASAEVAGSAQTAGQRRRFEEAVGAVEAAGLRPGWVHAGNTSAVDNLEVESHGEWLRTLAGRLGARPLVRAGLALYGYRLPLEGAAEPGGEFGGLRLAAGADVSEREAGKPSGLAGLAPVMEWKTRVIGVSEIEAGACVGYNATFTARGPMRLALLPVGYADGLRRELSSGEAGGGGWVMIRGRRASMVGRISMNLTTVDVTGIAGVGEGDEVILLGEGVGAEEHARIAGTIAYEILCGVRGDRRVLV